MLEMSNIVEISCPVDTNISKKIEEKLSNYGPLVRNIQMMYPEYKFMVNPTMVVHLVMSRNVYPKTLANFDLIIVK